MRKQRGYCSPHLSQLIAATVLAVGAGWGLVEGVCYLVRHLSIAWLP